MGGNASNQITRTDSSNGVEFPWLDSAPPEPLLTYFDDRSGLDGAFNVGASSYDRNFSFASGRDANENEETLDRTMGELVIGTLTFVAITMMTIGGNILVILSVLTYRPLTRVQNYFLVSLAVADLAVALFVTPFHVVKFIMGEWVFGLTFCQIWLTADILCCTASILNLCAIALDRYWAIHDPIAYASKRTLKLVLCMISIVWVLSLLISVPPLIGWNDWTKERLKTTCELTTQREFVVYSASGSFFIPLLVMATVYVKIFLAARHRLRRKRRSIRGLSVGSLADSEFGDRTSRTNSRRSERRKPPSGLPLDAGEKSGYGNGIGITSALGCNNSCVEYSLMTAPSTTTTTYCDDKIPTLTRRNTGLLSTVEEQLCSTSSDYDFATMLVSGSPALGPVRTQLAPVITSISERKTSDKSLLLKEKNGSATLFVLTPVEGKSFFRPDIDDVPKPRRQQSLHHFVHRFSERASVRNAKVRRSEPYVLGLPKRDESIRESISSHVAVEKYMKEKERISVTKEKKAAKTLAVIMGVFVLCWLPFFVTYLIKPFIAPKRWGMHPKVEEAITWLGYINSAINPVIYTIFNMDFRRAFQKFLCPFRKKKKYAQTAATKTATSGKTC